MSSIISVHRFYFSLKPRLTLKFTASSPGHELVVIPWATLCFPWAQAQQQSNSSKLNTSLELATSSCSFAGSHDSYSPFCLSPSPAPAHQHLYPTHLYFILKVIAGFFTFSWVISCFYTMHHGALHDIHFLISPKNILVFYILIIQIHILQVKTHWWSLINEGSSNCRSYINWVKVPLS